MIVKRILTEISALIEKEDIRLTEAILIVTNAHGSLLSTIFVKLRIAAGLPANFDVDKPSSPLLCHWEKNKTKQEYRNILATAIRNEGE